MLDTAIDLRDQQAAAAGGCTHLDNNCFQRRTLWNSGVELWEFPLEDLDPANQGESDLISNLAAEAVSRLEDKGAFFSRPYGKWVDVAYRRARDTTEMQKKVKDIFDPNWILNPGKLCF